MNQIVSEILVLFVALIFTLLAALAKPAYDLLKSNVKSSTLAFLKAFAKTNVSDLAQNPAWSGLAGAEKKQRAVLWLMDIAKKNNFPLDAELAGKLVEEAYAGAKNLVTNAAKALNEPF